MSKKSDGGISAGRRGGPGGPSSVSPMTKKMLVKRIAAGGPFQETEKRILEWWESVQKAGGQPEVEWLSSMGAYRVRSESKGAWEHFF